MRIGVPMLPLLLLAGCHSSLSPEWAGDDDDDDGVAELVLPSIAVGPLAGGLRTRWTGIDGANAYRLYIARETGVGPGSIGELDGGQVLETTETNLDVRGALAEVRHFIAVTAVFDGVDGPISPEASAVPLLGGWASASPSSAPAWSKNIPGDTDFGSSVAGGDFDRDGFADLLVGADEQGTNDEGRVYLYKGGSAGIDTVESETWFGSQTDEEYGDSLAVGDTDADGWLDLVVVARDHDAGQTDEGRVLVYAGAPGPWPQTTTVTTLDSDQVAAGADIVTTGDFDGDGRRDVVAGAPRYDGPAGADAGRVFVAFGATGPSAPQVLDGTLAGESFGLAVSAGDVNGDGYDDLAVGSPLWEPGGGTDRGRVQVFLGGATGLETTSTRSAEGTNNNVFFGSSVTAADVDGDGRSDLVIAGWGANGTAGTDTGRAYLVYETAGTLAFGAWTFEPDDANARLGESGKLSAAADVNGDGYDDVVLAAPRYDGAGDPERAGGAFLFYGSPAGLTANPVWEYVGTSSSADFMSVSRIGDVDGDGGTEFVISWPSKDIARAFEGIRATGPMPDAGAAQRLFSFGQPVTLADATFFDPAGTGHACHWDYGDGQSEDIASCTPVNAGGVTHLYATPGTYQVRLTVTNASGAAGEAVTTVTLEPFVLR